MTSQPPKLLRIFAEDRRLVTYRPRWNELTGGITSTLLLQQIIYWWIRTDGRPFYKFSAPCGHEDYRTGDSWEEELGMSRYELQTARNRIAVKLTQDGPTRKEKEGEALVFYWTDGERRTWYEVNEPLLIRELEALYEDEVDHPAKSIQTAPMPPVRAFQPELIGANSDEANVEKPQEVSEADAPNVEKPQRLMRESSIGKSGNPALGIGPNVEKPHYLTSSETTFAEITPKTTTETSKPARDVKGSRGLSDPQPAPSDGGRAGSSTLTPLTPLKNLGIRDAETLRSCVDVADQAGFSPEDVEVWFQQALKRLREIPEVREPLKVAIHRFLNDLPRPPGEEERVGVRVKREFQSTVAGADSSGGEESGGADRPTAVDSRAPATAVSTLWERAKAELRLSMTQATFERHFAGAEATGYNEAGILTIAAPSGLSKEWIEARFMGPCLKAAYAAGFEDINWIEVTVREGAA